MRTRFLIFILLCFTLPAHAQKQSAGERAIRTVLQQQQEAWNRADLESFMAGYWASDSLKFIGKSGLTYGWRQTLENYKKGYPTPDAMGQLTFSIISVELLSRKSAFVIGKWQLDRKTDQLSGHFTLLWKKIQGRWLIVADHSS